MGLETGISTIADLNPLNPTDGDPANQGDNHIRLIKDAIVKTFPNVDGVVNATDEELNKLDGVTVTPTEINHLAGATSPLQTQIDNMIDTIFPVGSTKLSTNNVNPGTYLTGTTWVLIGQDSAIVGAGTSYTGKQTFGANSKTITTSNMPAHTHSVNPPSTTTTSAGSHSHTFPLSGESFDTSGGRAEAGNSTTASPGSETTSSAGSHTHNVNIPSFTSGSAGSGSAFNVQQASIGIYIWERTA